MIISKTDYLIFRECPKNAWLKIHKPDIYYKHELSAFDKSIIETGNEVELYARKLFPDGILIEGRDDKAIKETEELLKERKTLFQPVFVKDGFLAALDILEFNKIEDKYEIIEVKASNEIKDKMHLYDLAFQINLLKRVGLNIGRSYILHLNPEYERGDELDIAKLFTKEDATEAVGEILEKVNIEMQRAYEFLNKEDEPDKYDDCICIYKGRSSHCTTFYYSHKEVPEYSIHDIARIGVSKKKLMELVDGGILDIKDVPEEIDLSEIQKNQVEAVQLDRPLIKKDKIREELRPLNYPIYFLDYETYPSAIPRFKGFSPYEQIPFQYSLHIVNKWPLNEEKDLKHSEYLHTGDNDPSLSFATSLVKDLGRVGSIIVWNKKFEQKRNEELARRVPSLKKEMLEINTRIYDLMDIFSLQYYVHKDFMGSTSIKYVLPVLAPELSYKKLEIKEGGTASMKWNEMVTGISMINDGNKTKKIKLEPKDKELIANNLKTYCKLDTYAMFAIWKHLMEL
jgi:hypothetical protein